jgi:hypothetical protein
VIALLAVAGYSQRLAIVVPDSDQQIAAEYAEALRRELAKKHGVDDMDMTRAAIKGAEPEAIFNMAVSDAKDLGSRIGTPYYLLIKAGEMRRSSSEKPEYYEAFAAVWVVSSASGHLVKWELYSFNDDTPEKAREDLMSSVVNSAAALSAAVAADISDGPRSRRMPHFQPVPDIDDPKYPGLRPPMPYRRVSPAYTTAAYLYEIKATVEIEADVDAEGNILRTQIVRWAGYGLDESVTATVGKMNWRPATMGKTALPMRVLLRYNFVKVEKNDEN